METVDLKFYDSVTVTFVDKLGSDDTVIAAARVSTKGANDTASERAERVVERLLGDQRPTQPSEDYAALVTAEETERDRGLINYLMRDRHGSPFEHVAVQCYVKAPIFVFREWHRHRIASYNEMSGRYTTLLPEFYLPADDRPLRQVGKPGAYTFEPGTDSQRTLLRNEIVEQSGLAWNSYKRLLEQGVAKEIARAVLPVNIYSQMYVTMNVRSLMNFLSLRTKTRENSKVPSFPQHEISLGADKLEAIFAEHFPWTYEAWNNNGRVAP